MNGFDLRYGQLRRPLERPALHPIYHPIGWRLDGARMAGNVQELRPKSGDTEKITMNLGYIDVGRIDLMVQEGFYSNRTDFIPPQFATNSNGTPRWLSNPRPERAWNLVCGTTRGTISKRCERPGRRSTSMCWGSPALR